MEGNGKFRLTSLTPCAGLRFYIACANNVAGAVMSDAVREVRKFQPDILPQVAAKCELHNSRLWLRILEGLVH
jgi:hypothetical protein